MGDTLFEANETFSLGLSQPTNATILQGQAVATIGNDDVPQPVNLPTVSISNAFRFEGNRGTRSMVFKVRLSDPSSEAVTVNYTTANGTAIAGVDYNSAAGTLTFNPGETVKRLRVSVIGDRTLEPIESFAVQLGNPTNANIGRASGTGVILNDDLPSRSQVAKIVAGGLSTVGNLLGNPFSVTRSDALTNLLNSSSESATSAYASIRKLING